MELFLCAACWSCYCQQQDSQPAAGSSCVVLINAYSLQCHNWTCMILQASVVTVRAMRIDLGILAQ